MHFVLLCLIEKRSVSPFVCLRSFFRRPAVNSVSDFFFFFLRQKSDKVLTKVVEQDGGRSEGSMTT